MAKKNKNEQIVLNLIKATEEFKVSYEKLKDNTQSLPPFEDERLQLEKKYYIGYIQGIFQLVERSPLLLNQYYEVIKNESQEMLSEILGTKYEMLMSFGEKNLLNDTIEETITKKKQKKL